MFKLFVFAMAVCCASAGIIGHGVAVAPVAVASDHVAITSGHVAVAHGHAESYQNNNQISVHPVPVVATHSVGVAHAAPVAVVSTHGGFGGLGGGLGDGFGGHGYHH